MPKLKQTLSEVLSLDELALLYSSFDVIGDIAVIKIPKELESKQQTIANAIIANMKNVRTVLKQSSDVQGEFRIRDLSYVSGEKKFVTVYKESGCFFRVDVNRVFFSPRLSTERERIASLVHDGEHVLNMFAGLGTFSIVIAKRKECIVDSVDKNPEAIELANESISLNKRLKGNVIPIVADGGEYARRHKDAFDRILMPLPERSKDFLADAFYSGKKYSVIHYYVHVPERDFKDKQWILKHLEYLSLDKEYQIMRWKKVREIGPRFIQAVADILVCS